jgi:hypothetical protein
VDDDPAAQARRRLALHDASNHENISSHLTPLNQNQVAIDDEKSTRDLPPEFE